MSAKSSAQHIVESIFTTPITTDADFYFNVTPQDEELSTTKPTVTVYDTVGFSPQATSDVVLRTPSVQIRIIGAVAAEGNDHYSDAQQKFQQIKDFMYPGFSHVVSGTTYFGSQEQGDGGFVGYEGNNRPVWSANFTLNRTF